MRDRDLRKRAATKSGSGWDKIRVGRDKIRVWMGQIQGPRFSAAPTGGDEEPSGEAKGR